MPPFQHEKTTRKVLILVVQNYVQRFFQPNFWVVFLNILF